MFPLSNHILGHLTSSIDSWMNALRITYNMHHRWIMYMLSRIRMQIYRVMLFSSRLYEDIIISQHLDEWIQLVSWRTLYCHLHFNCSVRSIDSIFQNGIQLLIRHVTGGTCCSDRTERVSAYYPLWLVNDVPHMGPCTSPCQCKPKEIRFSIF